MTDSSQTDIAASYAELIRTATCMDAVSAWYTAHPEVLGNLGTMPGAQVSVEANLSIGAVSTLLIGKAANDGLKARLKITISYPGVENPPYSSVTGLGAISSSVDSTYSTSMYMSFDVWPLAIAELAFDYIANNGYTEGFKETCRPISRDALNRYLPKHFPGINVDWLDSMQSMEFFPCDPENENRIDTNGFSREHFTAALFKSRNSEYRPAMPAEIHF